MKKFLVCYVTENNDLYFAKFADKYAANKFIENSNNKAILIVIESPETCNFSIEIEDHT